MKAYDIALFVFIFNYVLGLLVGMNIGVPAEQKIHSISGLDQSAAQSYASDIQTKVNTANDGVLANLNYLVESVKLIILALPTAIRALLDATIMFPVMLNELGTPTELNAVLTAIVWLTYFIGIAQLVSGRDMRAGA